MRVKLLVFIFAVSIVVDYESFNPRNFKQHLSLSNQEKRRYNLLEWLLFPKRGINTQKLEQALIEKTILITGATFGIGEQLAYQLAFKETELILVGRTADKLNLVKERIEEQGGNAEIYAADLRDDDQINSLIDQLKNKENGVDIFVSNAGKSIKRSIFKSLDRYHDFKRTMDINYHAPVKLCLALIPGLQERKGHILNISAINVLFLPMPEWSAYQASKTAFDQWFRSVSPELKGKGITTSSVYLPLVKTRMIEPTKNYQSMPAMRPEHVAKVISRLILKKRRRFKPWWSIFVALICFWFKRPIEFLVNYNYK